MASEAGQKCASGDEAPECGVVEENVPDRSVLAHSSDIGDLAADLQKQ
jgi:hypothetical protein